MKNKSYRGRVEVTGAVTPVNAESDTFTIGTDDGLQVKATYTGETKHRIFQGAQDPESGARRRPTRRASGRGLTR